MHETAMLGLILLQGQVYHRIGSMVSSTGDTPKFGQIYFIGNQESQVVTRCQIVGGLRADIVGNINQLLHSDNHYVQLFKVAKDLFDQQDVPTNIRVVINKTKRPTGEHPRRFNSNEIVVLMPNKNVNNRDIVLHYRNGGLLHISELHRGYDQLQYPLTFSHGTDGWHIDLKLANNKKFTVLVYYCYNIMVRQNVFVLLRAKRLFQQFLVIFGKPRAWLCSIEWQKHGLPHAHTLVWLIPEHKITPDKIDDIVCVKIPDPARSNQNHYF